MKEIVRREAERVIVANKHRPLKVQFPGRRKEDAGIACG